MISKHSFWSFSVALAGLLFGFDVIVISGAEKQLQELWHTTNLFHGTIVVGIAVWGTVLGALLGGILTNLYGRKKTLIGIGILFLISALGSALVNDPYSFAVFRILGGLAIGISTIAAPAYITEIAPDSQRGRLVAMYQLSIVMGILIAFLSNYLLRDMGEDAWRWMLGVEAIPAIIYTLILLAVPQSPNWLVLKGRIQEAKKVLERLNSTVQVEQLAQTISKKESSLTESIFTSKYRSMLLLVFFIAFFNQFSGINALLYYAPRIFEEGGLASSTALLSSVGVGIVNVVFTIIGMILIDRFGRKPLMYCGSVGYIISLTLVSLAFYQGWEGFTIPLFFFLFIAAHAIGQGAVIWVLLAELFPTHLRASAQSFGSSVHWVLAAIIPSLMPETLEKFGPVNVFAFFAVMMIGQLIWVHFKMPETKGKSAEEMVEQLKNN